MRLIDADALKEVSEIQMANFNSIDGVRAWIDRQPTAYDVEKVVEQIKDKAWSGNIYDGKIWVQHAEELIRKGGVNERD